MRDAHPLQAHLIAACQNGDFATVVAALADGASVNDTSFEVSYGSVTPLAAAVKSRHRALVLHLLSRGADVNGAGVMPAALRCRDADMLALVIDGGGDVNQRCYLMQPVLFDALRADALHDRHLQLLLAQPSLNLEVTETLGRSPARIADMLNQHSRKALVVDEVGLWVLAHLNWLPRGS